MTFQAHSHGAYQHMHDLQLASLHILLIKAKYFPPRPTNNSPDGQIDNCHEGAIAEHFLQVDIASTVVHGALP